ncbi:MAG: Clp protease N-terminal domain-containing protein, partial [Armatimonadetes bacterium]|nr:Clp protease N-terminal domain-containing protein [Armatimonadota bacterium]
MRFDKLTIKTQEAFQSAMNHAVKLQHQSVDTEHFLLSLLTQDGGTSRSLLEKL